MNNVNREYPLAVRSCKFPDTVAQHGVCHVVLLGFCVLASSAVSAHQQSDESPGTLGGGPLRKTTLDMSAAITLHSGDYPGSGVSPPGLLLSEEAAYMDDGLSLQAWSASLAHPLSASSWVSAGVETHGGHGSSADHEPTIELETLALSHIVESTRGQTWLFSLGRQSAAPQPWLNWHADSGIESVPSLLSDVFLARHRVDTGLKADLMLGGMRFGASLWNGDAWPATTGEGAVDLRANYLTTVNDLGVDAGVFISAAKAVDRGADDSSHSHSGDDTAIVFTGDSGLAGLSLGLSSDTHSDYLWSVQSAFLSSHESGDLTADAQQSGITSEVQGVRLHGQIEKAGRGIWLRHEWLSIDNHMDGAGGAAMAQSAGIADVQGRPARTVIGSWWDALPSVRWQMALQREYDGDADGWSAWLTVQWMQQWKR